MGAVLVIAAKDLRQRLRDRSAIVLGFLAPLVFATVMSFAFQGTEEFHADLGVVDADEGALAAAFLDTLEGPELAGVVSVTLLDSETSAREQVDAGDVAAAIVVPAGFTAAATDGEPAPLRVLTSVDQALSGQLARAVASSFVAQLNANRLSVASAIAAGVPHERLAELAGAASTEHLPLRADPQSVGAEPLRLINYYGPSMAIFFVLFAIGFAARSFFGEVRDGTLQRMSAAPIRPAEILAGKALSVFVYALASLGTVAVVTSVVFGADWGHPLVAVMLCLAMAMAVVALTALVISVARTERQADTFSSVVVFALALLGGNFVFVAAAPDLLRTLALGTPNGWMLRALTDLATTGGGFTHDLALAALPLAAMLGFSVVVGSIAVAMSRRVVSR